MNYNVYEILSIIFFILAGLATVCAIFYFLRFQIAHVIAVLSGRQAKKQIARWRDSMVAGERTTERLCRNDDGIATSVLDEDEKATSRLDEDGEEVTSVLAGDGEETTSILFDGGEEVTSILYEDGEDATSILYEDGEDATSILSTGSQESSAYMPEEKRMIHSAYIISLSGEPEPVQNT